MKLRVLTLVVALAVVTAFLVWNVELNEMYSNLHLCHEDRSKQGQSTEQGRTTRQGQNIVIMFTGRWKYIRINFPYLYRDLKENGGVLDKVRYMMVNYDQETEAKLKKLVSKANDLLGREVFELHYMGYPSGKPPKSFSPIYSELFSDIVANPYTRYFKMDDDIVYIHPGTFEKMLESKKTCANKCFIHFGNIVTNWRCSITHERMGLFDNPQTNPKSLKFEYNPFGNCGWKSSEYADIVLKTFLNHYRNNQTHKYVFDGCEELSDRNRFSINFFMIDKDLINIPALLQSGPMKGDDEGWWTVKYSPQKIITEPNCIVGGSFVVHFSYYTTRHAMISRGYLKMFEVIAQKEIITHFPAELWSLIGFDS